MSNNHYDRYCENDNCTNQLPVNALCTRMYCNICQILRKKLQLAVIIKKRRQQAKEQKLQEIQLVAS